MDYQPLIIKIKNLIFFILIVVYTPTFAQQCIINKVDSKPFYFSNYGCINKLYEKITTSESNSLQIMLINSFGQINKKEAFYISIDTLNRFNVSLLNEDSIVYTGILNTSEKYNTDILFNSSMPTGYLYSECQNIISSHKKSVLLVRDKNKIWVEYTSMDGYMKEALFESKEFVYLNACYNLIEIVFKDLKLPITK